MGTDTRALTPPFGSYDLIWVGSVITHLPLDATRALIEKLLAACRGVLVMSFHGHHVIGRHETTSFKYIHGAVWKQIKAGYLNEGYGYADYNGQSGYGISVITPERMVQLVGGKYVLLRERAWDGHHDIIARAS